jgi:DNA-binding CsgD family transcriptional regulator
VSSSGRAGRGYEQTDDLLVASIVDTSSHSEAVDSLNRLLTETVTDRGQVAIVTGPVGTGKSTVLQTFARRAVDLRAMAIVATGSPAERNLPMGVLNQLFSDAPLPTGQRSRVLTLLRKGNLTPPLAAEEVSPVEARMMQMLCTILINSAEEHPLAIVVDDIHYADPHSMVFLSYLARRVRFTRTLVVFCYPESGSKGASSLHAELLRLPHATRIRLSPMTAAGVEAMAAARLGAEAAGRHASAWYSLSGGNSLLLSGLFEDHERAAAEVGEALDEVAVGDGYGRAVVSCLHRGDGRMRQIGLGLAVLGDPDPVARLMGVEHDFAAQAVRELTHAGVLSRGRFRHPVANSAVLAGMGGAELPDLYRRAASLAVESGAPPRTVAELIMQAGECGEPWAVPVLVDAARQALRDGPVESAVAFLKLAGQECADERQRGKIMTDLMRTEWQINPSLPTRYLRQLVDGVVKGHLQGDDAMALASALLWHGDFARAREVFEYLGRSGKCQEPHTRAELAIVQPWLRCTFPQFLGQCPALPVATDETTVTTVGQSRRLRAVTALTDVLEQRSTGHTFVAVERVLRDSRIDDAGPDTVEFSLLTLIYGGQYEKAASWSELFLREAQSRNAPSRLARLAAVRAEVLLRHGDLQSAARHARQGLDAISPSGWGVSVGAPLATLVHAETAMANYATVHELLDLPVPEEMFDTRYGLSYLHARGRYSLATGHVRLALRDFLRCGERMAAWGLDMAGFVAWRIDAAEAYLMVRRTERARQLLEEQLELCGGQPRIEGTALRLLAATQPLRQRPVLLRHAADLLQSCGDRYQLALALSALAMAYEAVNEHRRARVIGHRARSLAEECHVTLGAAGPPEPHRRAGELSAPGSSASVAALLTEAERRVATLAAVGYTNREIAKKLYVTVSTVEQHLTRIYRKLEIGSRAELPSDLDVAPLVTA